MHCGVGMPHQCEFVEWPLQALGSTAAGSDVSQLVHQAPADMVEQADLVQSKHFMAGHRRLGGSASRHSFDGACVRPLVCPVCAKRHLSAYT